MKVVKSKQKLIALVLLIILGAFLRLYRLDKFPPSLFGDEVDVGYQAYSILKTGKDYMGQRWPISFHSLAEWRTPLLLYATVPFVAIFGLNEWGVRLPPAIFGILTLPLFFLLFRKIFKNENLALLGTFFLSISMWHLQYSRAAFEVTQMIFLLLLGLYLFLIGLEKPKFLPFSALFLGLTSYSYNTAKLFAPVFILLLIIVFFSRIKQIKKKWLFLTIMVLILVEIPMVYDIFLGEGGVRFSYLSIFNDPTMVPQIGFRRLEDLRVKLEEVPLGVSPTLPSRFFHNKFLSWGTTFLNNYFRAFSTEFLFTFGDINYRHSVQGGFGELYWLDAVFLLFGLYFMAKRKESEVKKLIFGWVLLAPIPSALTQDGGNHATRLILILPPLLILISFGIYSILESLKKTKQKMVLSFFIFTFYFFIFVLYLHRYYIHWPLDSQYWWHPGFKEAGVYAREHYDEYDQIVWSTRGEPPMIFFLFWTRFDPERFQKAKFEDVLLNESIEAKHLLGTKYYFGSMNERYSRHNNYSGALNPKILYIAPQAEIKLNLKNVGPPSGLRLLKIIDLPSRDPALYLLSG